MNERIKKIGKTAGFAFIEDSVYGQRWYSGKCGMDAEEFEKFAELIIKECSGVNYHSSFQDGEFLARELLEHFGVE